MHCSRCNTIIKEIKGNEIKPYCAECFSIIWGNDKKAYSDWFGLREDDVS